MRNGSLIAGMSITRRHTKFQLSVVCIWEKSAEWRSQYKTRGKGMEENEYEQTA